MDGLEFLEKVMRLRPFPVVMVSSLTARGATATIRAMELGAVDCVGKPSIEHPNSFDDLPARVRAAAGARLQRSRPARPAARPTNSRRLQAGRQDGRHRRFDRRRRGADLGAGRLSRELPADRRHRAHAEPVHPVVRPPARRPDGRAGRRGRGWRAARGRPGLPGAGHGRPISKSPGGAQPRCRLQRRAAGQRPSPVGRRAVRARRPRRSARARSASS